MVGDTVGGDVSVVAFDLDCDLGLGGLVEDEEGHASEHGFMIEDGG